MANSIADRLARASEATRTAVAEHSDEVVARISASGEQAVEAIRFHGDSVADRLGQASVAARSAAGEYADDVVARVSASGQQTVAAIRVQGGSVVEELGAAADAVTRDFSVRSNSFDRAAAKRGRTAFRNDRRTR